MTVSLKMNASISAAAACPPPFLLLDNYPYVAGQKDGRFCAPSPVDPMITCCLPCPLTDWVYPDNFNTISEVASWVGVGTLVCCVALLLSFAFLPAHRTSRHYLTICLIAAVLVLELAFTVPLGTKPNQCFDAITPNDLHSDVSCAVSGIFVLGGGFGAVMWVFIRSLSVHLQICWKIVPGNVYFYVSQLLGWGITALFLALSLTLSGVSYRLGTTCHINHENSVGTFWGPLVAFAGASVLIQLVTFAYCIKVYLQVANSPHGLPSTTMSSQYDSVSGSSGTVISKRATYRRIRKVIALQWRGMTVVLIVIVSACYLAIAFLLLDADVSKVAQNYKVIVPWVECLAAHGGDKTPCLGLTSPFIVHEQVVLPVLYLIAVIGFWALVFLGKWDMIHAWIELLSSPFTRHSRSSRSSSPTGSARGAGAGSSHLRVRSDESFSDRLRATPQQLHIIKGERGLSVANKAETRVNESWEMERLREPMTSPSGDESGRDLYSVSDFNHSLSAKDLESNGDQLYRQQRGHGPSYSQSYSHGGHSSSTQSGSQATGTTASYFPQIRGTPPPTTFEGVWAAPPARPGGNAPARSSFNFSRPSAVQPMGTVATTGAAHSHPTYLQRLQTYPAPNFPYPPHSHSHSYPIDPQRSDSTASGGGWYMSSHPPEQEEFAPLTPPSPVLLASPDSPSAPTVPRNTRNVTPNNGRSPPQQQQSQRRRRANTDSKTNSVYSLAGALSLPFRNQGGSGKGASRTRDERSGVEARGSTKRGREAGGAVRNVTPPEADHQSGPPQRPPSRAGSTTPRPSHAMAWEWDPASSFAIPPGGHAGPSPPPPAAAAGMSAGYRGREGSPALGYRGWHNTGEGDQGW